MSKVGYKQKNSARFDRSIVLYFYYQNGGTVRDCDTLITIYKNDRPIDTV